MSYSNRHHSNYLNQADGPILASDGLIERVANGSGTFTINSSGQTISGKPVRFSAIQNTGIVSAVVLVQVPPNPIDIMNIQGICEVVFGDFSLRGVIVSTSSNFEDSTFEISFMPDGDT